MFQWKCLWVEVESSGRLKCGTCCSILELQINVHLTNFPNLLIGNDLIELLFPYVLLVFLEMIILNTVGKKIKRYQVVLLLGL
jgi:hypothetical protein